MKKNQNTHTETTNDSVNDVREIVEVKDNRVKDICKKVLPIAGAAVVGIAVGATIMYVHYANGCLNYVPDEVEGEYEVEDEDEYSFDEVENEESENEESEE